MIKKPFFSYLPEFKWVRKVLRLIPASLAASDIDVKRFISLSGYKTTIICPYFGIIREYCSVLRWLAALCSAAKGFYCWKRLENEVIYPFNYV